MSNKISTSSKSSCVSQSIVTSTVSNPAEKKKKKLRENEGHAEDCAQAIMLMQYEYWLLDITVWLQLPFLGRKWVSEALPCKVENIVVTVIRTAK